MNGSREHPVAGVTTAYGLDCSSALSAPGNPELQVHVPEHAGSCPRPTDAGSGDAIWYTLYLDVHVNQKSDRDDAIAKFHRYLELKLNGEYHKHQTKPVVPLCLNYVMVVPSSINSGNVKVYSHLGDVVAHEGQFFDAGVFTAVMGNNRIEVSGDLAYGVKWPTSQGDSIATDPTDVGFYFDYDAWAHDSGNNVNARRIATHEFGHAAGRGHTACNLGASPHDWLHLMGLSGNAHSSCYNPFTYTDVHYSWSQPDSNGINNEYANWWANN